MKKIVLIFIGSLILFSCGLTRKKSTGDKYIRTVSNGGEKGYNYTSEKITTDDDGNTIVVITCSEPGYELAPLVASIKQGVGESFVKAQQTCTSIALLEISKGNFRGRTVVYVEGVGNFKLKWIAKDKEARTSKIEFNKI